MVVDSGVVKLESTAISVSSGGGCIGVGAYIVVAGTEVLHEVPLADMVEVTLEGSPGERSIVTRLGASEARTSIADLGRRRATMSSACDFWGNWTVDTSALVGG